MLTTNPNQSGIITTPPLIPAVPVKSHRWKHIDDIRKEGIAYVEDRFKGLVQSLKTPWESFNDAGVDGLEWGNVVVLGGRPASGKTLITSNITRRSFDLNPMQNFGVLDLQFEMTTKATAIREFSSIMKMNYKQLLNADKNKPMTMSDILNLKHHLGTIVGQPIYQIEEALNVKQIEEEVELFWQFLQKPFVVTIDHSVLVKKGQGERDKFETLYELGEALTRMKKKYPVIFIVLTQMNRSIEEISRKQASSPNNFPNTADIFGADALLQHCDMMMAINRPFLYNIPYYGPDSVVVHKDLIAMHYLKVRNGEPKVEYYEADFPNNTMKEATKLNTAAGAVPAGGLSTANINPNQQKYNRN
jgi:replicative DNA helicase